VIKIRAVDSPNIRFAEQQKEQGKEPTNEILVPGVADYATYLKRRLLWDPVRQSIGLDAEFYEGGEVLLYPPDWLNRAEQLTANLQYKGMRSMGIDPDLYQIWHSSQSGPHQLNFVGYSNPEADDLIIKIRQEYDHERLVGYCRQRPILAIESLSEWNYRYIYRT
jgi:hypothetical protein